MAATPSLRHTSDTSIRLEGDPFMNNRIIHNESVAIEPQSDLVTLWRLAVLGNRAALQAFLRRVMPDDTVDMPPAIVVTDVPFAHRRPARAAA
jgi:hypothetical protein